MQPPLNQDDYIKYNACRHKVSQQMNSGGNDFINRSLRRDYIETPETPEETFIADKTATENLIISLLAGQKAIADMLTYLEGRLNSPFDPSDLYKTRCNNCICLVEAYGKWYCDEADKEIHELEDCPEGLGLTKEEEAATTKKEASGFVGFMTVGQKKKDAT